MMKRLIIKGIIKDYDGYGGVILGDDNEEYFLMKKSILDDKVAKKNDYVIFFPIKEELLDGTTINIASTVKVL